MLEMHTLSSREAAGPELASPGRWAWSRGQLLSWFPSPTASASPAPRVFVRVNDPALPSLRPLLPELGFCNFPLTLITLGRGALGSSWIPKGLPRGD